MKKEMLELYSDYLLSSFGYTTAAGFSDLPDSQTGHDRITDFLSKSDFNSSNLWLTVRETVRSAESDDCVLIFDDTAEEKQRTDENEIITWHYDHSRNRTVKGVSVFPTVFGIRKALIFRLLMKSFINRCCSAIRKPAVSAGKVKLQKMNCFAICPKCASIIICVSDMC